MLRAVFSSADMPCPCSLPAGYDVNQADLAGKNLIPLFCLLGKFVAAVPFLCVLTVMPQLLC